MSQSTESDKWSTEAYNTHASFVYSSQFTSAVLDLLHAQPGEHILDIGCGSGEVTLELQRIVGEKGLIVGTDFSANMVSKARENGVKHCYTSDAQDLHLEDSQIGTFDAVFSNAALHWMSRDPAGVLRGVKRALKPGGRFVAEMGGFLNIVGLRSVIHAVLRRRGIDPVPLDPWYFPSVDEYQALLEYNGFTVNHISLNPRITPLPGSLVNWLITFARTSILGKMNDEEAQQVMEEVEQELAIDCRDSQGKWSVMYVRLRFMATSA